MMSRIADAQSHANELEEKINRMNQQKKDMEKAQQVIHYRYIVIQQNAT